MAMTFDEVLPTLNKILLKYYDSLKDKLPIIVNRNLYGRISFIMREENTEEFLELKNELFLSLGCYASESIIFFENAEDFDNQLNSPGLQKFAAFDDVYLIERTCYESSWNNFKLAKTNTPVLAIWSESLYVKEKRNLVKELALSSIFSNSTKIIDVDFESKVCSPFVSVNGVLDWLIEDSLSNYIDIMADRYYGYNFIRSSSSNLMDEFSNKMERAFMPRWKGDKRLAWNDSFRNFPHLKNPITILICQSGYGEAAAGMFNNIATHAIVYDEVDYLQYSDNIFSRNGAIFVKSCDELILELKKM